MAGARGRAPAPTGSPSSVPGAGAVRQDAADRARAVEVLRLAGGLHRRRPGDRPGLAGSSSSASTAPARPRCCGSSAGVEQPDTGEVDRRARAQARLLRAGARDARRRPHRAGEHAHGRARPRPTPRPARCSARSCSPATTWTSRRRAVRRREDPARAGDAGRLERQRAAARRADQQPRPGLPRGGARARSLATPARSCWSPTTRARCEALEPERVLLLPDGVEDLWSDGLRRPGALA